MTLPTAPHDSLFRALVSNPRRAAALLREHLPGDMAALIDFQHPPEPQEGSFVDGTGAKTQCDALFRVRLKGGQDARVYVLLEHKSKVDPATPLQVAKYMLNIWARELEETRGAGKLPMILPVVFYHGSGAWTAPLSLAEMIEVPEGVDDPLRGFTYGLRDLGRIDPLHLSRQPEVLAGLMALRFAYAETIPPDLLDLVTGGPVDGSEFEGHLLQYIIQIFNMEQSALVASLQRTRPQHWETLMGTVAQEWMEQGKTAGIAEGKAEGKAEAFLRLARLKFGTIPDARVAQVCAAQQDQLDAWLDALILAEDLDAVFARRSGH